MVFKKTGILEEDEIVLCTVKKILFHSVFVTLDEYENKEGMIHISEIAPGRIRNIRDYVKEGKKIVCKILRIHADKGHIDLSLRRVNNSERIKKNNDYKQEQKAEKLLENVAKKNKKTLDEMYKEIGINLVKEYGSLNVGFQNIAADNSLVKSISLQKKIEDTLLEVINEKIKPIEVKLSATLTLQNNSPNGIEVIKNILSKIKDKNLKINYISAPKYRITLTAPDFKIGEAKLKQIKEKFLFLGKENNCLVDFARIEN